MLGGRVGCAVACRGKESAKNSVLLTEACAGIPGVLMGGYGTV